MQEKLGNYTMFSRYDSEDDSKHMGLVGLCSKTSKLIEELPNIEKSCFRLKERINNSSMETYIQGMIITFHFYKLSIAFLYIRRKPNKQDILLIKEKCKGCNMILGDLNLNPMNESEKLLLELLCGTEQQQYLKEITTKEYNQLDHRGPIICYKFCQLYLRP